MKLFTDPPLITVELTAGGYIGYIALALFGLLLFAGAAVVFYRFAAAGFIVAGIGALPFMFAAFHLLRTVEATWNWPNIAVWCSLLGAGIVAGVVVHLAAPGGAVWLPPAGAAVSTVIAAIFDKANEALGAIPMSWGTLFVLLVVAAAFFFERQKAV